MRECNKLIRYEKERQLYEICQLKYEEQRMEAMEAWIKHTIADYYVDFSLTKEAIRHAKDDVEGLLNHSIRNCVFKLADKLLDDKIIIKDELFEPAEQHPTWSVHERRFRLNINAITTGY